MTRKRKQKKQRGATWEPSVIYRADRSKWMVDCGFKFGKDKRVRKMFETEMDATTWAAEKKSEFLEVLVGQKRDAKVGAFTRLSSLTNTQRNHIVSAMAKIENDTAQIVRAVDFYFSTVKSSR